MSEMARRVLAAMGWRLNRVKWEYSPATYEVINPQGVIVNEVSIVAVCRRDEDVQLEAWDRGAPDLANDANACVAALDAIVKGETKTHLYWEIRSGWVGDETNRSLEYWCEITDYVDVKYVAIGATPCEAMLKALASWHKVEVTS